MRKADAMVLRKKFRECASPGLKMADWQIVRTPHLDRKNEGLQYAVESKVFDVWDNDFAVLNEVREGMPFRLTNRSGVLILRVF